MYMCIYIYIYIYISVEHFCIRKCQLHSTIYPETLDNDFYIPIYGKLNCFSPHTKIKNIFLVLEYKKY